MVVDIGICTSPFGGSKRAGQTVVPGEAARDRGSMYEATPTIQESEV